MPFVLDASVAVAWFLPSQATPYTARMRTRARREPIHVPALWRIEVINAVYSIEDRGNISANAAATAVKLLAELRPVVHEAGDALNELHDLCRRYDVTAYDATYIALAVELHLPVASKDVRLRRGLDRAGIKRA